MAVIIDLENTSLLRAAPRLMQILRVLTRHNLLRLLFIEITARQGTLAKA